MLIVPRGFKFSGISCGIKKKKKKKDLALIYATQTCIACGMFTQNKFKAYPVLIDIERLKKGEAQVILVNSGCANALTGKEGREDALEISRELASLLKIEESHLLLASTGTIGERLPVEKVKKGLPILVEKLSENGTQDAAEAIMTTDTFPKFYFIETTLKGRGKKLIRVGGIAKGAGMISPQLATMLCFLLTDACITREALKESLRIAMNHSFNRILVDGDMSTNDTVIILASGLARNPRIKLDSENFLPFTEYLTKVSKELAKMIVKDGEGATKMIEIRVKGAWDEKDAHRAARSIARSPLVKTAIYGGDPNWGRILSSLGQARVKFKPNRVILKIQGIKVFENLTPVMRDKRKLIDRLQEKEVIVEIDLQHGPHHTVFWTCDLTEEYVKINAHYRT
ncbi:bifunctional glutamate N-acetyltransferase/amino-acid acetyltransferase ArgJ [Candidatus Calescamantes bacterium]|nr:bifunctional glutamate N-acetyltransferase/amino-acid acetyltransferase ArgJ [Candidatus Calescamantes bacterium]